MDSVQVSVVASPLANFAPLYEVDPDADVLLIVPPSSQAVQPCENPHHVNGINGGHKLTDAAAPDSQQGLRIKVSSKHLALASRVLNNKLQFGSNDAVRQSDGRVHLVLAAGFDAKAVGIVMGAIHGRGSKVPRTVDLETLAQIALFVDRFRLLDAVEIYAERWISNLQHTTPSTYNRDLVHWIYISHVFRRPDIFRTATKVAATQSSGPIETLGLPIREKIIKHIDTHRQTLIHQALTHLHEALDTLTSGSASCPTRHCDSVHLGELIKSLHRHHLVWPRPAKPFAGVSFASVIASVDAGLALHRQQQEQLRQHLREIEPWFMKSASATKDQGPRPGWGVVGGIPPITPAASPEPVFWSGSTRFGEGEEAHECEARRVVAGLGGLERLGDGVEGLVLEGKLGYQAY